MTPTPPFWFTQRQGKLEAAGDDLYKLTAPNLGEAFLGIRADGDRWRGFVWQTAAGPELSVTEASYESRPEAISTAFELYRRLFIV
jgi:hypothetical protein